MHRFISLINSKGGWKLERLAAFCDGVIAIVITLLVLGIEVPSVHNVTQKELGDYLLATLPSIIGYVVSFIMIGMYWMQHYAIFHFLTHANRPFVILNGIFLLFLTFLPFPTGLHAVYFGDKLAAVIYGGAHILSAVSLLALWLYATQDFRLVSKDIPREVVTSMNRRLAVAPFLFLVAICAAFINPWLSRLIFMTIPCCCMSQRAVDEGWLKMEPEVAVSEPPTV